MARMSKRDALDQRMRGRLPDYLRARRARDKSPEDISVDLLISYNERVTAETVRSWLDHYEIQRVTKSKETT